MKKFVLLSIVTLCLPWTLTAQSTDDDLYFTPSKKKVTVTEQNVNPAETETAIDEEETALPPSDYTPTDNVSTIVVRDRNGNVRDVDEYNRRYDNINSNFSVQNDTLYIDDKGYSDVPGEWVNGFDGSDDDYEYAMRIIRFRNPRYAISISSPLYWDVVYGYGFNSWDWNVYTDGLYAYVFPTFTNRLWWDWRFNSYGLWGYPYWG
ncbi:MAG: hypothetical protein LUC23_00635, partial [Prevotellaceae bacterium]|nr:hypothetical protein [Prevotellaceae bacterium]